jgi:transcriptional regulator with XRE-family HTH domain
MTTKHTDAVSFLEGLTGGPLTFGRMIAAIRLGDEISQTAFARKLGISRQNLCDIEKSRTSVSPARAARWAKLLGYSEHQFVALALQAMVDDAGLAMQVQLVKMPKKRPTKPRAA